MYVMINGEKHEISFEEADRIHRQMERMYMEDDIRTKLEEMERDMSEKEIERAIRIVQRSLGNNDAYMECYWDTIENAINMTEYLVVQDARLESQKVLDVVDAALNLYGASELNVEASDGMIDVVIYERHCDPHPYFCAVVQCQKCDTDWLKNQLDKRNVHSDL